MYIFKSSLYEIEINQCKLKCKKISLDFPVDALKLFRNYHAVVTTSEGVFAIGGSGVTVVSISIIFIYL